MKTETLGMAIARSVVSRFPTIRRLVVGLALTWISLSGFACAGDVGETLRWGTYPPDFNYIPADKLESTMWQLAAYARELDQLVERSQEGVPLPKDEVVRLLLAMERTSAALGPGGWPSNHPRVSHNIEAFRREVARARFAAERDPPNYFRAGTVTGACTHCHQGS